MAVIRTVHRFTGFRAMHTTATTIIRSMELLRSPGSISPVTRSPVTRNMTPGRVRAATPAASVRRQAGSPSILRWSRPTAAAIRRRLSAAGCVSAYSVPAVRSASEEEQHGQDHRHRRLHRRRVGPDRRAGLGVDVQGRRRQGRQGHRNVADDERRFEQQEQRWLHRGSARRLERKLRRRLLRLHQQGLPAEEAGAGQKKQELQQELDNYKKKYGGSSSYDNQNSYDSYGDSYDSYGDSYDSTGY